MPHFKWFVWPSLAMIATVVVGQSFNTSASASSSSSNNFSIQRAIDQSRRDEIRRQNLNLDNIRSAYVEGIPVTRVFDQSVIAEGPVAGSRVSSAAAPPPPSPGFPMGQTAYDYQGNTWTGYQTARASGANIVHFIWMSKERIPAGVDDIERNVNYMSYNVSGGTYIQDFGGLTVSNNSLGRAGFGNGDVFEDNTFQATMHQASDLGIGAGIMHLNFPTPGNALHIDEELGFPQGGCPAALWPKIAASRDGDRTVHIIAHSNSNDCPVDLLWYWRHNGTAWTGPVIIDSTNDISFAVADDPAGDKVAVVVPVDNWVSMNGINNVAYIESNTDGAGWIAGTEPIIKSVVSSYADAEGPQAWLHLTAAYDRSSVLHLVWDEQLIANLTANVALRHWNSQRGTIRTITIADWDLPELTGVFNLSLAKLSIGIGDGSTLCQGGAQSNENYLYVLYTQFGGETQAEKEDVSFLGYYNGELYLSGSMDGGSTWSSPVNLTNTKTPNCNPGPADTATGLPPRPDSVCRSEHWASIGLAVDDIDIFFISDLDAGGMPQGEGTWQLNPVHYFRIPGGSTDAQHICPLVSANFETQLSFDPNCDGYYAIPAGQRVEALTIMNLGNTDLTGEVSVTDFPGVATLTVSDPGPYSVLAGASDLVKTVTMSANGAPDGVYSGTITITHNAPGEPSPRVIQVDLHVTNFHPCIQCNCPCWADPNCDGVRSDVLDVVETIAAAFRGTAVTLDPGCPAERTDVDADGSTNVEDVVRVINVAFRGQTAAANYIDPCL